MIETFTQNILRLHHNKANKIRNLYNYHIQNFSPEKVGYYIVVDFPAAEEEADTFEVFLSWSDFEYFLDLPTSENRLRLTTIKAIRSYLNSEKFSLYPSEFNLTSNHVFFNVVPLIVNAASKLEV